MPLDFRVSDLVQLHLCRFLALEREQTQHRYVQGVVGGSVLCERAATCDSEMEVHCFTVRFRQFLKEAFGMFLFAIFRLVH